MRQQFTLELDPPTTTHQMKKVRVVKGHPQFYEPAELKKARATYMEALKEFAPLRPYEGPIKLATFWYFSTKTHKGNTWKTTKPDTDNIVKLLKDCMTEAGFWKDDALVCCEHIEKRWTKGDGFINIYIEEIFE